MTAIPMTLKEALNLGGAVYQVVQSPAVTIGYDKGTISLPATDRGSLKYEPYSGYTVDTEDRPLNWALYIDRMPLFANAYRPVLMGHFLDRFLNRRLAYDTVDEWMLAFRRWSNLNMPYFNQRYLSAGVPMPLDTVEALTAYNSQTDSNDKSNEDTTGNRDENTTGTRNETSTATTSQVDRSRDVGSEFPDEILAGNKAYASNATDTNGSVNQNNNGSNTGNESGTSASNESGNKKATGESHETKADSTKETGRRATMAALLMEQREALLNVDMEVLDSAEKLFLGLFDQDEYEPHDIMWALY